MRTDALHELVIESTITCPICGKQSHKSTYDARMNHMAERVDAPDGQVAYDVSWTVINARLDCGHQIIRDGNVVEGES